MATYSSLVKENRITHHIERCPVKLSKVVFTFCVHHQNNINCVSLRPKGSLHQIYTKCIYRSRGVLLHLWKKVLWCLSPSVDTMKTKHGPTHYNFSPMRGLHRVHLKTTHTKQRLCLFFLKRSQNFLHASSRTAESLSVASQEIPANHQQKPNPRRLKVDWLNWTLDLTVKQLSASMCLPSCMALVSPLLGKCTNRGVTVFFPEVKSSA